MDGGSRARYPPEERLRVRDFAETASPDYPERHVIRAVADMAREERKQEAKKWKAYYNDENCSSDIELSQLSIERAELERPIKALGGTSGNHDWTFEGVQSAVDEAKSDWENKRRIGGGKVQKTYHDIVCGLEAHSTLFACIPSSNTYVSIAAGAVKCLVGASRSHRDTIEQLTRSLKEINDEAQACVSECQLFRSKPMQLAIAKFYAHVFMFYGDAINWYKSHSAKKALRSFNSGFSERFQAKLDNIKRLSNNVKRIASIGSMAESRASKLELDNIVEDLKFGLAGIERQNAQLQQAQRDAQQNLGRLAEGPIADALYDKLAEGLWRRVGLQGTQMLLDAGRQQDCLIAQKSRTPSPMLGSAAQSERDVLSMVMASNPAGDKLPESLRDNATVASLLQVVENLICSLALRGSIMTNAISAHHSLIDERIVIALDRWARAKSSLMLYVEGPLDLGVPSQSTSAAAKLVSVAKHASVPVLSYFCDGTYESDSGSEDVDDSIPSASTQNVVVDPLVGMVLSLAYQLLNLLPPLESVSTSLDTSGIAALSGRPPAWPEALNLFWGVLNMAPAILLCAIDSFAAFHDDDLIRIYELLSVFRDAMAVPGKVFKVLFTSITRVTPLVKELDVEEMELIEGSTTPTKKGRSASRGRTAFVVDI